MDERGDGKEEPELERACVGDCRNEWLCDNENKEEEENLAQASSLSGGEEN